MHHQLYILRRENKLTPKDMANILRISKAAYQNRETSKIFFTIPEALLLANYFRVTLDELFNQSGVVKSS